MSSRAVPFGKYHLLERVNVGGMAEVYKAKMVGVEGFEKLLAIKRILPSIAADQDFINMFIDEAKISVQLNHANIAQIFELGRLNDTYYIALEYVPGRDLRAVFERMRRRGEQLPPELVCYVVSRVAEGLDYAHRKRDAMGRELGIIHRDISPQNVLVSYEGEIKLIDFGIAKAANKIMKTQAGILKGKFGYMSPEQVRGLPLDRRSDIFAAGIVLYELLAGDRLFTGESDYSILEQVRAANVPRLTQVRKGLPPALERIVLKALAKDPDERYQHASELVADLQRWLLARDRLYTREDLAAFMKSTFAEEWEREKRSMAEAEAIDDEDATPHGADPAGSVPLIRSSLRPDGRPRLEGGPARAAPPPPPPDALLRRDPPPPPLASRRSRPRLAAAAQAAETDKIDLADADLNAPFDSDFDDETTTTETDPSARVRPRIEDEQDEVTHDELTPEPASDPALLEMETRVQRVPVRPPPPVPSQPAPARSAPSRPPPGPVRLPTAITDNLPQVRRQPPPPIFDDDDDEHTVMDASGRTGQALRPDFNRSIGDEEDESETFVDPGRAEAYRPRRRTNWTIVPVAVLVALGAGFIALQLSSPSGRPPKVDMDKVGEALASRKVGKAALTVITEPPDAQVFLGGKLMKLGGDKPFVFEQLEANVAHLVEAKKDGFESAAEQVTLELGESKELRLTLRSKNPVLRVESDPPGALITIEGEEYGRTPKSIGTLASGTYRVRAELKCFKPIEKRVRLGRLDEKVVLKLEALPGACVASPRAAKADAPGRLRLICRPPAKVFIDGVDIGRRTPLIDYPLPPGPHSVRLVTDAGSSEEFDIDIEPGKPLVKRVVIGVAR